MLENIIKSDKLVLYSSYSDEHFQNKLSTSRDKVLVNIFKSAVLLTHIRAELNTQL